MFISPFFCTEWHTWLDMNVLEERLQLFTYRGHFVHSDDNGGWVIGVRLLPASATDESNPLYAKFGQLFYRLWLEILPAASNGMVTIQSGCMYGRHPGTQNNPIVMGINVGESMGIVWIEDPFTISAWGHFRRRLVSKTLQYDCTESRIMEKSNQEYGKEINIEKRY
jgi:hypothetical protein